MQIDDKTYRLPQTQFYEEVHKKKRLCLHFTAGSTASGAHATFLGTGYREGTAYLIGRDGQIYELFDPRYWALHLFRHKKQDPSGQLKYRLERETIGIEIVNPGPLFLGKKEATKDKLYPWYAKDKELAGTEWATLADADLYTQKQHRGHFYYANFSVGQYQALLWLTEQIASWFDIDITASPILGALDYWPLGELDTYRGMCNHGNFRRDKLDLGPAFDWARIGYHGYRN